MVDWNNGNPNARLWVLKLVHDNFGPGDKIVEIAPVGPAAPDSVYVTGLAVVTKAGRRKMLLVNKRDRNLNLSIAGAAGGNFDYVAVTTDFQPPVSGKLGPGRLLTKAFAFGVLPFL